MGAAFLAFLVDSLPDILQIKCELNEQIRIVYEKALLVKGMNTKSYIRQLAWAHEKRKMKKRRKDWFIENKINNTNTGYLDFCFSIHLKPNCNY